MQRSGGSKFLYVTGDHIGDALIRVMSSHPESRCSRRSHKLHKNIIIRDGIPEKERDEENIDIPIFFLTVKNILTASPNQAIIPSYNMGRVSATRTELPSTI